MSRLLSVLAVFIVFIALADSPAHAWDGTTKIAPPLVGGWYEISTAEQLAWVADKVNTDNANYADKKYRLVADVDLSGREWTPIGDYRGTHPNNASFKGAFDGGGHVVRGMKIAQSGTDCAGLFGHVESTGDISGVGVEGFEIAVNAGNGSAGGLVGENRGTITACWATGSAAASHFNSSYAGGLVGYNGGGTIAACWAAGDATATATGGNSSSAGGLVGENLNGEIAACYATGDAKASGGSSNNAGGLVGSSNGEIAASYATGGATGTNAGGFVGLNFGGTIAACFSRSGAANPDKPIGDGTGDVTALADMAAFSVKNSFGTSFDFAADWCYTDHDGGAKPNPRAFFDPDVASESGRLNAVSRDLTHIYPAELSLDLGGTAAARITAFFLSPDVVGPSLDAPGVSVALHAASADAVLFTAPWFTEDRSFDATLAFGIRSGEEIFEQYPKKIKINLTGADKPQPVEGLLGSVAPEGAEIAPLTALPGELTAAIPGAAPITHVVPSESRVAALPKSAAPKNAIAIAGTISIDIAIGAGSGTSGDTFAATYAADLSGLSPDLFPGWSSMTDDEKIAAIAASDLSAIYDYVEGASADETIALIGSGDAVMPWSEAFGEGVAAISGDKLILRWAVGDGPGAPKRYGDIVYVPDGLKNDRIKDPLWLAVLSATPTPTPTPPDPADSGSGVGCTAGAGTLGLLAAFAIGKRRP